MSMNIKIVVFFIVSWMFVGKANAQQNAEAGLNKDAERLNYVEKIEKYRRMKTTGATLTVAGSVLLIVGTVIFVDAPVTDTEGHELESGLLCMIAGQAGLGAGIPLWIVGANNQKGYTKKLQQ